MMKRTLIYIFLATLLVACSTTRYVPDSEQLYTGIKKMEFTDADTHAKSETGQTAIDEIKHVLECPPNGSFMGSSSTRIFPIGLWIYNTFRNSRKGIGSWLFKTFAKDPVLISDIRPELRANVATDILKYYGYFNGMAEATVNTHDSNPKKASVTYKITLNKPSVYDTITYIGFPNPIDTIIQGTLKNSYIKDEEQFNATLLEKERNRISNLLRNNGYYHFQPSYIRYLADTIATSDKVSLRIQPTNSLPGNSYRSYSIGNISVRLMENGYSTGNSLKTDSFARRNFSYIYYGRKMPVRAGSIQKNIPMRTGEPYSQNRQQRTLQMLTQMNLFSSISLTMNPRNDCDTIDVNIITMLDRPYDFTFEFNATSKSNSQIGPGSKITLAKKNLFRSGETLKLSLTGSYEWQTDDKVKGRAAVVNSWEMGADISLTFPRLFLPIINRRYLRIPSTTSLRIYTDQMNRSGFFRIIHTGGDFTYKIFSSNTNTHTVTPLRLTYDMLLKTTAKFDSIAANNRSIENSFRNQFIPAMQYTYTYDESKTRHRNKTWLEVSLTSAGNATSLIYWAFGEPLSKKNKNILDNPYAQFVKGTAELRKLWKISSDQHIANRIMIGAIHSYGNAEYAPYSEQFYIGGANSLRAFTVRSVGPGSYRPKDNSRFSYLDETGTLKFEMNIEYRFRLVGYLHGAIFADAGNIWLIKKDTERPGGEFRLDKFAEQLALNTGFGVRYDLEFLVLRLDFGLGLHAPYKTKRDGYFNLDPLRDGFAWHFGIGYPF